MPDEPKAKKTEPRKEGKPAPAGEKHAPGGEKPAAKPAAAPSEPPTESAAAG